MAPIPPPKNLTVNAIFDRWTMGWTPGEKTKEPTFRPHLGASEIGGSCSRKLWYGFRWAVRRTFDGRTLRLLNRGKLGEIQMLAELRAVGIEVWDTTPEGKQIAVSFLGGHFAGSVDGIGKGFKESSKPHVIEIKTANEKSFNDMQKKGVRESKPVHFCQMQIYMLGLGLTRAFYCMDNKNDSNIYQERTELNQAIADGLLKKAERIITSESPMPKLSEDAEYYECKYCDCLGVCHKGEAVLQHCRTCRFAEPNIVDGGWGCTEPKDEWRDISEKANGDVNTFICERWKQFPAFGNEE